MKLIIDSKNIEYLPKLLQDINPDNGVIFIPIKNHNAHVLIQSPYWPNAVSPSLIIDEANENQKISRARLILDSFITTTVVGKRILDFGCGEGHLIKLIRPHAKTAIGYDPSITNDNLITSDINIVKKSAPYDIIIAYDVLDHVESDTIRDDCIKTMAKLLAPGGVILTRIHPYSSRHATHVYRTFNKAYAHMIYTHSEMIQMGLNPTSVLKSLRPLETYRRLWKQNGLMVSCENIARYPLDDLFYENDIFQLINRHWYSDNELYNNKELLMDILSIQFIDYELSKMNSDLDTLETCDKRGPVRVAIVTPVFYVGGVEQWIMSLSHWFDSDRIIISKIIVTTPGAIDQTAVLWLPRWVEVINTDEIVEDGFDIIITWGLKDLVSKISHLKCPTIDTQHGAFMHEAWQIPLVKAATEAHWQLGTTIVGVNEAIRMNFEESIRNDVVIIPNGSDPTRVYSSTDKYELKATLNLTSDDKIVMFIGRITVEKNVQALIDAMQYLDKSWHAVIIGPQYVTLERLNSHTHLIPAQRNIGSWLNIADVLCHPSDYESHCFSINEAWLAGVPVVSCDYLVNRMFEEKHGQMMWLVPTQPKPEVLADAISLAYQNRYDGRVKNARDAAINEYSAPIMSKRWANLIEKLCLKR